MSRSTAGTKRRHHQWELDIPEELPHPPPVHVAASKGSVGSTARPAMQIRAIMGVRIRASMAASVGADQECQSGGLSKPTRPHQDLDAAAASAGTGPRRGFPN